VRLVEVCPLLARGWLRRAWDGWRGR
jgi:hypothetical protein